MLYILSFGAWPDHANIGVFEGPDGLDTRAMIEEYAALVKLVPRRYHFAGKPRLTYDVGLGFQQWLVSTKGLTMLPSMEILCGDAIDFAEEK